MNNNLILRSGLGLSVFILLTILPNPTIAATVESCVPFDGAKTAWHGFDRYDFLLNEQTLAITPFTAAPDEQNGIKGEVEGQRRCVVVVPKQAATGNPWSWRGVYWDHQPQTEVELLKRGFHIAYVQSSHELKPTKTWDAWYAFLTEKHGLSPKPAFIGMSRGGEYAYTWSTANPDKVSCLYVDNPGLSRDASMRLADLARNDVPVLQICGSLDPLLGKNALALEAIYQQYGGRISMMVKEGAGHHPHSLRDPKLIADFIVQSVQSSSPAAIPAFAGEKAVKSSYYGVETQYRDFPSEGLYIACRGPIFSPCYNRYSFELPGVEGSITVIEPKSAAPGKPWVFRADFVDRNATVDLALLAKGFHIVTGPVPFNADGPLRPHWDAVYKHLTDNGFSRKPVMEGAGAAAGESYAWAIENPDKVACIYGENPVLRSAMAKTQPIDNLAALAQAGVPILHVCGGLDPHLNDNTRVAEKRYKELGGQMTVIVHDGQGRFLSVTDPKPAVDFITQNTK